MTRTTQDLGEPEVRETHRYDTEGRELPAGIKAPTKQQQIEGSDVEGQAQRDREYEERMEDEYAKREGGV